MKRALYIVCFVIVCIIVGYTNIYGAKATANIVNYRQPDGSIVPIRIYGDEFFGWMTGPSGNIVSVGPDGFLYNSIIENGLVKAGECRVNASSSAHKTQSAYVSAAQLASDGIISAMRSCGAQNINANASSPFIGQQMAVRKSGKVTIPVILVEFNDQKFSVTRPLAYFNQMLNGNSITGSGMEVSASKYLNDNFAGACEFTFDVVAFVSLSKPLANYGGRSQYLNDVNPSGMVIDACRLAESSGVNFSKYDNDSDGKIDNVAIIYAGYSEAESGIPEAIWPHKGDLSGQNIRLGGLQLSSYTCTSELAGDRTTSTVASIGPFLHEFCHALGLPDLYDVNGDTDGASNGLYGNLSIMDFGLYLDGGKTPPYFCAVEQEMLSLSKVVDLTPGVRYTLRPFVESSVIYRIPTKTSGEYFLLEMRRAEGWDSHIGGEGLVVYHIDKSSNKVGGITAKERWEHNAVNTFAQHCCAELVVASPNIPLGNDVAGVFFPGTSGTDALSALGEPPLVDWNNRGTGVALYNITFKDGIVTFSTTLDIKYDASLPVAGNFKIEPYQSSALIGWSKQASTNNAKGEWLTIVREKERYNVVFEARTPENFMVIKGLEPGREYEVSLSYLSGNSMGEVLTNNFSTLEITSGYPYVAVKSGLRVGDRACLPVLNLTEEYVAATVKINGTILEEECYKFTKAGEYLVEVAILFPDGSEELITKRLYVKE